MQACQGAQAEKRTLGWVFRLRGALQADDLRLAQHLCELDSPLRADVVAEETAKDAWVRKVREQACHGACMFSVCFFWLCKRATHV